MLYAPHTLYKKSKSDVTYDALGKPIVAKSEDWVMVGECRCDDDTTQELRSDNGQVYWSRYHVVYDKSDAVVEGDEIQCTNADGSVRGGGIVGRVKSTNYLGYSELWT